MKTDAVDAFLALPTTLRDTPLTDVRQKAADVLEAAGEVLGQHPTVLAATLTIQLYYPGADVRWAKAVEDGSLLEALDQPHAVFTTLLTTLCDDPHALARLAAAGMFGSEWEKLGQYPTIFVALLPVLRATNALLRREAANRLAHAESMGLRFFRTTEIVCRQVTALGE